MITEKKLARIAEEMESVEAQRQRYIREFHKAVERGESNAQDFVKLKCMSTGEMDGMWMILDILGYEYEIENGKVKIKEKEGK